MLWPDQSPGFFQPIVQGRCRKWSELTKYREPGGPGFNLFKRAFGDAARIVVHAKNKGRNGVHIARRQPAQDFGVLARFVEVLVHIGEIGGVNRFHTDENPLTAGLGNQVHQLFVAQ